MNTTPVGIDIAKAVFEVALSDRPGTVLERHRFSRERFRRFFAARDATDVLMEACGSAHYWGRELQAMGHRVVLLHPGDVARYRDGNKTDRADAKAILEAARNSTLDPVPVKSCEQQATASLHRMRQGLRGERGPRCCADPDRASTTHPRQRHHEAHGAPSDLHARASLPAEEQMPQHFFEPLLGPDALPSNLTTLRLHCAPQCVPGAQRATFTLSAHVAIAG